jgi:Beta/Gamma crystallin
MRISKAGLLAGIATAMMLAGATAANARPGLILYQQDYFRGASYAVSGDEPDLGWSHFDDRASSVEVRRGVWLLCTDSRFRGRCITVDHDVQKLSRMGMDDKISSVRRIR